ncbi:MAG: urease accessory protein UreD [Dehalococcoidia bacterium]
MTASIARLEAAPVAGVTRIARAFATSPQRWTVSSPALDGWTTVTHQLLGDGSFGGDSSRAVIRVESGAKLIAQGVTATALRGCGTSTVSTHLLAAPGAALLHLPGPVVPHQGSNHRSALRIGAADGAFVLAASTLVAGRMGLGERGAYERLRLNTTVRAGGSLAFREQLDIDPDDLAARPTLCPSEALVTLIIVAAESVFDVSALHELAGPGALIGFSRLRSSGSIARAIFPELGAAQEFLRRLETYVRELMKGCLTPQNFR